MNRNTLILIIFLGIFAALVAGVNLGKKQTVQKPSGNAQISSTPEIKLIADSTCGISFSYPETYTKIDIASGGMTIVNPQNTKDTIVVICQEEIPRVPLPANKIDTVQIGTISASLYHDASQKDGTAIDKLIFTNPVIKQDVYVSGIGSTFDTFLKTISLR